MTLPALEQTTVRDAFTDRRAVALDGSRLMVNDLHGRDLGMRGTYSRFEDHRDRRFVRLVFGRSRFEVDLDYEAPCLVRGDSVQVPKFTAPGAVPVRLNRWSEGRWRHADGGYMYDSMLAREPRMFLVDGYLVHSMDDVRLQPGKVGAWTVFPLNLPKARRAFPLTRQDDVVQLSPCEWVVAPVFSTEDQPANVL